ncbi:MAG: hypothetical protein ACOYB4_00780 [Methyloceanibacter sp.]
MEQDDPLDREGGDRSRMESAGEASSAVDWEAIEHEYIYGDKSLKRISDAFGSSPGTISARAKDGGWVRLVGTKRLPRGRKARLPGAPRTPRSTADQLRRRRLAQQLFKIIDAKLQEIETRMQQAEANAMPPSAADTERDVRSINSLMGLYAKVVELDEAAKQSGSDAEEEAKSEDAEQLRRDLARRLERLNREGNA